MLNDDELDALLAAGEPPELSASADARVVASLDALVVPSATPVSAGAAIAWSWGHLPWRWVAGVAFGFMLAAGVDLGRPAPLPPAPRDPWRCPPNPRPALELPQERHTGDLNLLFN